MSNDKIVQNAIRELERAQETAGDAQRLLLDLIFNEEEDEWGDAAQVASLKLEVVQRTIGEIQIALLQQKRMLLGRPTARVWFPAGAEIPMHTPGGAARWLDECCLELIGVRESSPIDASADNVARFLGDHFQTLEKFYRSIKTSVRSNKSTTFSLAGVDHAKKALHGELASMLHKCSFFTRWQYDRSNTQFSFTTHRDGRVVNFFTGEWLERYTLHVLKTALHKAGHPQAAEEALIGIKVRFPDGGDGEIDMLSALPGRGMLWLECKSGIWQQYSERFSMLHTKMSQCLPEHRALILLDRLSKDERASASSLTGLQVMHLSELPKWLDGLLGSKVVARG